MKVSSEKSLQQIYYALGLLAYSVAKADTNLTMRDRKELSQLLLDSATENDYAFAESFANMIPHILEKERKDVDSTYNWVLYTLKANLKELNKKVKKSFISTIGKVVNRFPSSDHNSNVTILDRLNKDLNNL